MLVKDNSLFFVSKKGIVDYGKVVYGGTYSGVELITAKEYHDVFVEPIEYDRTGNGPYYIPHPLALVDPITGEMKMKLDDVIHAEKVYSGHSVCIGVDVEFSDGRRKLVDFDGNEQAPANIFPNCAMKSAAFCAASSGYMLSPASGAGPE